MLERIVERLLDGLGDRAVALSAWTAGPGLLHEAGVDRPLASLALTGAVSSVVALAATVARERPRRGAGRIGGATRRPSRAGRGRRHRLGVAHPAATTAALIVGLAGRAAATGGHLAPVTASAPPPHPDTPVVLPPRSGSPPHPAGNVGPPPPSPSPSAGTVAMGPAAPLASASGAVTHVVAPGDCLWDLAAAQLGPDATAAQIDRGWRRLYAANRAVIGDDPNRILPGQRLTLVPLP